MSAAPTATPASASVTLTREGNRLALAGRLTKIATVRSRIGRSLRNVVLQLLGRSPVFCRKLALDVSGLARKGLGMVPTR